MTSHGKIIAGSFLPSFVAKGLVVKIMIWLAVFTAMEAVLF